MIVGCETPRLFTPARRELTPATSHGFACVAFAEEVLGIKLLPWQRWLLLHALEFDESGMYLYRIIVVEVARQSGKALDCETPILTTAGWSTMGALRVGDEVYHPDGHPTRVVGAFEPMHRHRCYEVTTTDGRTVIADADHLWTVSDVRRVTRKGGRREPKIRTYGWETLTTEQLLDRGLIRGKRKPRASGRPHLEFAFRLPRQHRIISKPVDLPIDPYVLGAWLGDGSSLNASLSIGDADLDEMRSLLIAAGMRIVSEKRDRTCWKLQFNIAGHGWREGSPKGSRHGGFQSRAARLGIWGPGNKHVPQVYLTAGTEQRAALLAGLLDTDGSIAADSGHIEFCSMNERLADAVLYLARSLGWRTTKRSGRATLNGRDCGTKYRVCFTPDESPFRLTRKSVRIKPCVGDRQAVSIRSIREVPSRPVCCIKVDRPDGLFLAGDGLMPTHNTLVLLILALWHIYALDSRTVIGTAQDLTTSEKSWAEAVEWAITNDELAPLIESVIRSHPKVLKLVTGCEYRIATSSRRGGRGFSGDLILLDELREHQSWDSWASVTFTMNARPRAQAWCFSNAGDSLSVVLRYLRACAHRELGWPDGDADSVVLEAVDEDIQLSGDSGLGWFEWSAPPHAKRDDLQALAQANPGLNHVEVTENCVTERALLTQLRMSPPHVYDTECMCRWVSLADGGPFPEGSWALTLDDRAMPAEGARSAICIEVSAGKRERTYIARAALDELWRPVVGIWDDRVSTEWVWEWLQANRAGYSVIVLRSGAGTPARSLLDEIEAAGLPLEQWASADVSAACGQMFDLLRDSTEEQVRVRHRSHPGLDSAATSAAIKVQAGGAWMLDLKASPTDPAPLLAALGAVWGLSRLPDDRPSIYAGADGADVMVL